VEGLLATVVAEVLDGKVDLDTEDRLTEVLAELPDRATELSDRVAVEALRVESPLLERVMEELLPPLMVVIEPMPPLPPAVVDSRDVYILPLPSLNPKALWPQYVWVP
jgi:hypothetical protein